MRDVFAVAVKHQCFLFLGKNSGADATFPRLTPAWMANLRIDVSVETVLVGCRHLPAVDRLARNEAHFNNRFDALEAVFPRYDEP